MFAKIQPFCVKYFAAWIALSGSGLMLGPNSAQARTINQETSLASLTRWSYLKPVYEETDRCSATNDKLLGLLDPPATAVGKLFKYGAPVLVVLFVFFAGAAAGRRMLRNKFTQQVGQLEMELAKQKQTDEDVNKIGRLENQDPNPFLRIASDGAILYHNKASLPLLRVWRYWKALPSSSAWYQYIADALGSGQPRRGEVKCGDKIFSLTFAPVVGSGYVDVHGLDITDHKLAEEKLRERGEQFWAIAGYSHDLESWHGLDGRLEWINPAVKRITGYSMQECRVMPDYPLPLIHEDDREDVGKVIRRFTRERTSGNDLPFRMQRKDGSVVWVAMSWQPIYDAKGIYEGIRSSIRDITERKQKEEQILRQNAVLNGINEVFEEALTCESDADVARTCLAVAEKLTGSKFGFIGELNKAGLFDTIAISNPGWNACKMPDSEATRLIKNMEIRGIWSRVLKDEQSQIVNEPGSHPDRVGTPRGHPPVTCFLGVPLKEGGKTFGIIGLANKESGYELDDQEAIESLSIAFIQALMRKRAEKGISNH
jgi:PAS domain S-box-containing protein